MSDDFIYGAILVSYFFGAGLLRISSESSRFFQSIILSALLYGLTLQVEAIYGLTLIFSVWLALKFLSLLLSPKVAGTICFVWCFIYLGLFRIYFQSERMIEIGLIRAGGVANAFQIILTLRVSSFAIDSTIPQSPASEASFIKYFSYCIYFIGAYTGPWFPYRIYESSLVKDIPLDRNLICNKLISWVGVVAVTLFLMKFFPKDFIVTEEFLAMGFIRQMQYILVSTTWFRCKFYFCWLLTEVVCILGNIRQQDEQYPQIIWGENVDLSGTEFQTTISNSTRRWNLSVNSWLVMYVYKKIPGPKAVRSIMVMLVSAYWHGFEFGLYLWALGLWLGAMTESRLHSISKGMLPELLKKVIAFLLSYTTMSYGALAFFFKEESKFPKILEFYNSTMWIGFTGPIAIIVTSSIGDICGKASKSTAKLE